MTEGVDELRLQEGWSFTQTPIALTLDKSLRAEPKVLWNYIAWRAGAKRYAWPGIERIAHDMGVSGRSVQNWLGELEASGWLRVERRANRSSLYEVVWHKPEGVVNIGSPGGEQAFTSRGEQAFTQNDNKGTRINEREEEAAPSEPQRVKASAPVKESVVTDERVPAWNPDKWKTDPALVAVERVTGRAVPRAQRELVCEAVGLIPNEALMRECWKAWLSREYKVTNWAWLTEWYVQGGPPLPPARASAETPMDKAIREYKESMDDAEGVERYDEFEGRTIEGTGRSGARVSERADGQGNHRPVRRGAVGFAGGSAGVGGA